MILNIRLYKIEFDYDKVLYLESFNDVTVEKDFYKVVNEKYHNTVKSIVEVANEL